jgi:hypothetical protein
MKKLLKAKCGVKPIQKGQDGWAKHCINYYNAKTTFANRTEKRIKVKKEMRDKMIRTPAPEPIKFFKTPTPDLSNMTTGLSYTQFEQSQFQLLKNIEQERTFNHLLCELEVPALPN